MRFVWRRLVLFLVTLVTLLAPAANAHALVGAGVTGWFTGNGASVVKEGDIGAAEVFATAPCTNVTLPVISYYSDWTTHVMKSNENMCMTSTLNGLIDRNGSVIQPYGFDEAHAIADGLPGHGVIRPIPNQDSVIYFSGSSYNGALSLNLYRNFYSHLHYNFFRQSFDLNDAPDFPVRFADGLKMPVNPLSLTTSPNGRYIVADVVGTGYVRIDTATLEVKPFAASNGYDQFGNPLGSSLAIDNSGRYAALSFAPNGAQDSLKIVDIDLCTTADLPTNIGGKVNVSCPTRDVLPAIAGNLTGMRSIVAMQFVNENVLEIDAKTSANSYIRYAVIASGAQKTTASYLAMGDSFIAGEGAWSYRNGTDTGLNKCHQSVLSYPYLLSGQFTSFASVACSGARLRNMTGDNDEAKTAQLKNNQKPSKEMQEAARLNKEPGYVRQIDFVGKENPDVITLSMVGNDIGFKDIIVRCAGPFMGDITPNTTCYQWYEDRLELVNSINGQFNKLVDLYSSLKATNRKVYIIGYPQIVAETGSCGLNVRLDDAERKFANELIDYLDSVIQRAAEKAGVFYVDTQDAFDGSKLCEGKDLAVNGLTSGDDAVAVIANESYHPNQRGYQLLANAVAAKTHNFSEPMPVMDYTVQNPTADDSLRILQAPKMPRGINQTEQANEVLQRITRGKSGEFDATSYGGYLAPNSQGNTVLHSTPVALGPVQVDANGEIHAHLTIPADVPPGIHTLHFYVKNIAGQPVDIQKTVYVAASDDDFDGDGVPNSADSCASIPNSGVDEDADGLDDACDPEIAAKPTAPSQTNETSNIPPSANVQTASTSPSASGAAPVTPVITAPATYFQPAFVNISTATDSAIAASDQVPSAAASDGHTTKVQADAVVPDVNSSTRKKSYQTAWFAVVATVCATGVGVWFWVRGRRSQD